MRVVTEEVFGPVLPIVKFSNDEEVLQMANDTDYGLSAYFYTENQERIQKFISNLESGHVSVNGTNFFSPKVPFGGYKKSGIGRVDGEYGYLGVTQIKVFSVGNR
jgi:acyl-CoA reductase-like NAD-dependent aldehyde dehydrogenase